MAYNQRDESVSGYIKDYVGRMDIEHTDHTVDTKKIELYFTGELCGRWSNEENLKYRVRANIRQCLNQLGFYSIGNGEYYDIANGTNKEKDKIVLENQRNDLEARVAAINNKRKQGLIAGQFQFVINDEGDLEIVEAS